MLLCALPSTACRIVTAMAALGTEGKLDRRSKVPSKVGVAHDGASCIYVSTNTSRVSEARIDTGLLLVWFLMVRLVGSGSWLVWFVRS